MIAFSYREFIRLATAPIGAKKFSLVVCFATCFGLSITAALNFLVDPMAQFGTEIIPPVVQTSRAQKSKFLSETRGDLNGLVLGSSRVLKIEPDFLKQISGVDFYNAGVNHGRPEDWLALVRYFRYVQGRLPTMVLIGVDVSSFDDNAAVDERLISNRELRSCVPEAITKWQIATSYTGLISYRQTKASLGSIRRFIRYQTATPVEELRDDGVIVYHERESQIKSGEYDFESAMDYNRREYVSIFRKYNQISARRSEWFKKTIALLRDADCQVCMFLTPIHPALESELERLENFRLRKSEVRNLLVSVSDETGADFMDLSSLSAFDGLEGDFVDGIHPLESNTRRMMTTLYRECARSPIDAVQ